MSWKELLEEFSSQHIWDEVKSCAKRPVCAAVAGFLVGILLWTLAENL